MATHTSASPAATENIGREFARQLQPGSVVGLVGPLGSGKTQFVKGLVAEIGARTEATSPTFTLIHEYSGGRLPVYHFDFFRLEDRRAAERLGLEEYFFSDGVCLVEWADKFEEVMPPGARRVYFETKSETERLITIA
ncbi:MAG TPA: tRNA (adenosine(37)-N6)-threonylcarbamoyltransferase complex ATPase subunit type 1 TsaE [Chthoniobacterales bacterium]|nr:tRNA (adenosine(37)-N6)-threonylcarbamoyltransferase complex ATPase subunit type 1 TsaE [Chthoniobacterales bacterium]